MNFVVAALASVWLFYVGSAFLKAATVRMEPLHGRRPGHALRQMLSQRAWLTGVLLVVVGLELQVVAFSRLSLGRALPLFGSALALLVLICVKYFGERLARREWLGLGMFLAATICLTLCAPTGADAIEGLPSNGALALLACLSLAVPVALFPLVNRHASGRHARPLAGIAYGLTCGVLIGTGEIAVKGLSIANGTRAQGAQLLAEPFLYLIVVAMGLAVYQGTIALQRCRMVVPMVVCTIVAKTYLVVAGSALFGVDWPGGEAGLLRVAGIGLAIGSLFVFPPYEAPAVTPALPPAPRPPADVHGGPAPSREVTTAGSGLAR
jgi:hypothetical protein